MSNEQTYFIAWHPEYGYISVSLHQNKDSVMEVAKNHAMFRAELEALKECTIRRVRLVDVTDEHKAIANEPMGRIGGDIEKA